MPSSLRAPEAVDRLLTRHISRVALMGTAAAVEWARTASVALENFSIEIEETKKRAGLGAATSQSGGTAAAVAQLPGRDRVNALVENVRAAVKALGVYRQLVVQVGAETSLEVKDSSAAEAAEAGAAEGKGEIKAEVWKERRIIVPDFLIPTVHRVVASAAWAMEQLAEVALANTSAARDAAIAAAKAAAEGKEEGGGTTSAAVDAIIALLPQAINASNVAQRAAAFAEMLPLSDADLPKAVPTSVKNARTSAKTAENAVKAMASEAVKLLLKSSVSSAALTASVHSAVESAAMEETRVRVCVCV